MRKIFILPSYKHNIDYMKYKYDYWDNVLDLEGIDVVNVNPSNTLSPDLFVKRQYMELYEHHSFGRLTENDYVVIEDWIGWTDFSVKAKYIAITDNTDVLKKIKFRQKFSGIICKNSTVKNNPLIISGKYPILKFPKITKPITRKNQILFISDSSEPTNQYFFAEGFKKDFPQYEIIDLSTQKNVSSSTLYKYFSESKMVFSSSLKSNDVEQYLMALQFGCVPFLPFRGAFRRMIGRYTYSDMLINFDKMHKSKKWRKPAQMLKLSSKLKYHIAGIMNDYYLYELQTYIDFNKNYSTAFSEQSEFVKKILQI